MDSWGCLLEPIQFSKAYFRVETRFGLALAIFQFAFGGDLEI